MPDMQDAQSAPIQPEQHHESDVRLKSSSRRAAAVEAAYILEAVRK